MLKVAQRRIEKARLAQRVNSRLGDAKKLPFEADSIDALFISFVLELIDTPEIPIVVEECKRVLRTDDRTCVVATSEGEKPSLAEGVYEWMHENFPSYVDCTPIFVQDSLEDAGFIIVDSAKISMLGLSGRITLARKQRLAQQLMLDRSFWKSSHSIKSELNRESLGPSSHRYISCVTKIRLDSSLLEDLDCNELDSMIRLSTRQH